MERNELSLRRLGVITGWDRQRWLLVISFLVVYLVWGSTYLGIKFAIQTMPPYFMAATRFLIAGGIMLAWGLLKGGSLAEAKDWKNSALTGFLLVAMGNGGIVYAAQFLPSGFIALFVTIEPFWVLFLLLAGRRTEKPGWKTVAGLFLGFSGTLVLLSPGLNASSYTFHPLAMLALVISTFSWALGSVMGARSSTASFQITSGMQMVSGGTILLIISGLLGEFERLDISDFSVISISAFLYLLVFGSLIGYSAYSYLVRYASPSQVSTYAYVNPLVAVLLGALIGKETVNFQIVLASCLLVSGVVLVLGKKGS